MRPADYRAAGRLQSSGRHVDGTGHRERDDGRVRPGGRGVGHDGVDVHVCGRQWMREQRRDGGDGCGASGCGGGS